MRFDKAAVPSRGLAASRQRLIGGGHGAEIGVVPAVHEYGLEIKLAGVPIARETGPVESLITEALARNQRATRGITIGGPQSNVRKRTDSLYSQTTRTKRLIKG